MKKKWILLVITPFLVQPISVMAKEMKTEIITEAAIETETTDVQMIEQGTGREIPVEKNVDLGDYEITVSNVQISQNAGTKVADPAHKYLCLDVSILNWMLEDLKVESALDGAVIYDEEYRFTCDTYCSSLEGIWNGTAIYDEREYYYIIEINDETEDGSLWGTITVYKDEEPKSEWNVSGVYNKTTGNIQLEYGNFEYDQGGYFRFSTDGIVRDSIIDATVFWEEGTTAETTFTRMENLDSDRTDHTMIEPLVERQYGLCVLLTNAAADGLKNGKLDLNITIGGECYIVNLE